MSPRPVDGVQLAAERTLADAQLDDPALLGLDVAIAVHERRLCRSGRGDLRPRADLVVDETGRLLVLGMPARVSPDQERALVNLALALGRALRPQHALEPPTRARGRARIPT